MILLDEKAKVFWTRRMNPNYQRAYYFSSFVGDEKAQHALKVRLRDFGLEPMIIVERQSLGAQRANLLHNEGIIEKAKKLDIALAVRMLEDSRLHFDTCHLYTSDVDFLPAIEVMRTNSKQVVVHGYREGMGQLSPLFHECDMVVDLEEVLRKECEYVPSTNCRATAL